jgi:predicted PurR-regulated permease PerM
VELPRARGVRNSGPPGTDSESPGPSDDSWVAATQVATVGLFILALGAGLYVGRPILMPVLAAVVIGTTLAPIVKAAARRRVPPWMTAILLGSLLLAVAATAVTLLAQPISDWIGKAPEIGATIKQKLYLLDKPLNALHELQQALLPTSGNAVAVESSQWGMVTPVIAVVTPAAIELVLFFVTLIFFLAVQMDFRRYMASFFTSREAKLRFIRVTNEIEGDLASYVAIVTAINCLLGVVVALGAWLFGLPNPFIFGALATVLNYMPYIGAAAMAVILLGVGLVTFPSPSYALVPPAAFVALATLEGQFITPTVLGRSLTLNPLLVLLALAFWAWLWGPIGAFLAVPFTIVGVVVLQHLFPPDESKLPG